ncbi:hypothetical protein HHI36_006810 [Cryptolaemus montrouzieri]|uniref:G-protein coupled receptors family 1 profile domain-containing protein n=1 Tax=Cryptolaemus montrouzieri TaxID=559131 RepID=A0ABD2NY96_9CUCU
MQLDNSSNQEVSETVLEEQSEPPSRIDIPNMESDLTSRKHHLRTRILLILSTVFIVLNSPIYLIYLYNFFVLALFGKPMTEILYCAQQIALLLYFTSYSMNFFIHTMEGSKFRRNLCKLFKRN